MNFMLSISFISVNEFVFNDSLKFAYGLSDGCDGVSFAVKVDENNTDTAVAAKC